MPAQIPPYVAVADPNRWVVKRGGVTAWKLLRLGFLWWPGAFEKKWGKPQSFASMGAFAMELRDLGVAFSAGRDWSPSEVVQYLRDEGHFAGHFTEIAWRTDGGWELNTL